MSQVSVRYFAVLKEYAKVSEEKVNLESGDTGAALYLRLAEKYGFPLSLHDVRLAVSDSFVEMDRELVSGEDVVFIQPVAGG